MSRGTDVANLAKDSVFSIKVGLFRVSDEELGFICIGSCVCHGEDSAVVELCQ